jgi:hypothetical protein
VGWCGSAAAARWRPAGTAGTAGPCQDIVDDVAASHDGFRNLSVNAFEFRLKKVHQAIENRAFRDY